MKKITLRMFLVLLCAVLMSLGTFAAKKPTDPVTRGDALVVATRLHAIENGYTVPAVDDALSAVIPYAKTYGIGTEEILSATQSAVTYPEMAYLLKNALPNADLTVKNPDVLELIDMQGSEAFYAEALVFCQAGIFDNAEFSATQTVTKSVLEQTASRLIFPEKRAEVKGFSAPSYKQAYLLAYTPSMDSSKEGLQSGWEIDNRAGNLKTTLFSNYSISDIMTDEKSRMIRHFNLITKDKIEIRAEVTYGYGFDGNVTELCDADGSPVYRLVCEDGAFCIQKSNGALLPIYTPSVKRGPFKLRLIIDLEKGVSETIINNKSYGIHDLLGDTVKYFAFSTSDKTINITSFGASYMFANYAVYEDLTHFASGTVPFDMTLTGNATNTNGEFVLSGNSTISKTFEKQVYPTVFSLNTYLPTGTSATAFALRSNGTDIVKFTAENGKLYANGTELKAFSDKLWYKLRMEADPNTGKADIKVNSKVLATVDFLAECNYFDEIRISNSGSTIVKADDLKVYSRWDYDVPKPVKPAGEENYTIGMNVCSLWLNGEHWGWGCVTPFDDIRPVLGYYDEGVSELADWENKYMAEHGIDFQAFCWYANESNAPFKTTGLSAQLDEAYLNSKYGDDVNFCLIWETATSPAKPANSAAFRNYYVPYWIENYFSDPRYVRIDNKAFMSIFGADDLIRIFGTGLKDEFQYLRDEVKKLGYDDLIISASHTGTNNLADYGFDAWNAYNWGRDGYTYSKNVNSITNAYNKKNVYAIPSVSVGFNEIGWAQKRYPLMTVADYEKTHKWVRDTFLPNYSGTSGWKHNFLWLSTWNEYGEGTYIMPSEGLNGFGYLDVLRDVYSDGGAHTDIVPTEEQKSHFNHLYPQDRRILRPYGNYALPAVPSSDASLSLDFTVSGNWSEYVSTQNINTPTSTNANGTTFKTSSTNADAIMNFKSSVFEGFSADSIKQIQVTASGIPVGSQLQLFFCANGETVLNENDSIRLDGKGSAETVYTFDMTSMKNWKGSIYALRLDPMQKTGTTFTIKNVTFVPRINTAIPEIYINDYKVNDKMVPEPDDQGTWCMPFNPGTSYINFLLYTYHEWDYDTKTLKLYRDDKCVTFTVGSNIADIDGTPFTMTGTVFQRDNIPYLPIESICDIFDFGCQYKSRDYYITTPEDYIFDASVNSASNGTWDFDLFGATSGWGGDNTTTDFGDGTVIFSSLSGQNDMRIPSSQLNLNCAEFKKIEIRLKSNMTSDSNGGNLQLFFATDTAGFSEAQSFVQRVPNTGDAFVTVTLDTTKNANWKGTLTRLRLDPFNGQGTVEIDYIHLISSKTNIILGGDASSGASLYTSDTATVTTVKDPENAANDVFFVKADPGRVWTYFRYDTDLKPGKTYEIHFDAKLAGIGSDISCTASSTGTQIFANMIYTDASGSRDHVVKSKAISVADGWVHYSAEYTIPGDAPCTKPQFSIYTNPVGELGANYYLDNVVVMEY